MGKRKRGGIYVVCAGRETGVFTAWSDVAASVLGYSGACFQRVASREEADQILAKYRGASSIDSKAQEPAPSSIECKAQDPVKAWTAPQSNSPQTTYEPTQPTSTQDIPASLPWGYQETAYSEEDSTPYREEQGAPDTDEDATQPFWAPDSKRRRHW